MATVPPINRFLKWPLILCTKSSQNSPIFFLGLRLWHFCGAGRAPPPPRPWGRTLPWPWLLWCRRSPLRTPIGDFFHAEIGWRIPLTDPWQYAILMVCHLPSRYPRYVSTNLPLTYGSVMGLMGKIREDHINNMDGFVVWEELATETRGFAKTPLVLAAPGWRGASCPANLICGWKMGSYDRPCHIFGGFQEWLVSTKTALFRV